MFHVAPAPLDSSGAPITSRATIKSAIAPLHSDSRPSAPQISQLLRGHLADVLQRTGDWVELRGADGYSGWCHVGYLALEPIAQWTPVHGVWQDERRMSLGCTVRSPSGTVSSLPLGALLDVNDSPIAGLAMNHRGRARYFAPDGDLIVQRTTQLFTGTSYQWGGVTPWGADCSGMVQTMYALSGRQLPRDAWQQAELGNRVVGVPGDLRAGDLLFFSDRDDGKITHVAMSSGGPTVIHCALANGGFGINALDANDPVSARLRATFRFATRVL